MFSDLPLHEIFLVVACMLVGLTFHEAMHAFAAHYLGDTTARDEGRLTLNPAKHVDLMLTVALPAILMLLRLPPIFIAKPVPFSPERVKYEEFGVAIVGVAGPLSNLLLAAVGAATLRLGGIDPGSGLAHIILTFIQVNVLFFVFNMIPFPPLDGSRLLYAFAPDALRRVMDQIEAMGFALLIMVLLLASSIIGPLVSNVSRGILQFLLG